MKPVPPYTPGPCSLAIVGSYPGADDVLAGRPFARNSEGGGRGAVFDHMLKAAGIQKDACLQTYAIPLKPMGDDPQHFFVKRAAAKPLIKGGWTPALPAFDKLGYLKDDLEHWVRDELWGQIAAANPNCIVALDALALWALTGQHRIGALRGTVVGARPLVSPGVASCPEGAAERCDPRTYKVVPTYGPGTISAMWDLRPVVVLDLGKALRAARSPAFEFRDRVVWVEPTLEDLDVYYHEHIAPASGPVAVDIETDEREITCVGVSRNAGDSIVIPIVSYANPTGSYWSSPELELGAIDWLDRRIVGNPDLPKVYQNGTYDIFRLWWDWRIRHRGPLEDTMHQAHALQPELSKGLGFLSSIHTDSPSWKGMLKQNAVAKRDA